MIEDVVRWSCVPDINGRPMILIGGAHFPQPFAAEIAQQILKLLENPRGWRSGLDAVQNTVVASSRDPFECSF